MCSIVTNEFGKSHFVRELLLQYLDQPFSMLNEYNVNWNMKAFFEEKECLPITTIGFLLFFVTETCINKFTFLKGLYYFE